MHEKHEKTNAMRQLDRKKAVYTVHSYDGGARSAARRSPPRSGRTRRAASKRSSPPAKPAGIMSS